MAKYFKKLLQNCLKIIYQTMANLKTEEKGVFFFSLLF